MSTTVCTKDHPLYAARQHPDAVYQRDDEGSLAEGGCYAVYECPHCKKTIYEMIAD